MLLNILMDLEKMVHTFIFGETDNHDINFSNTFERINKGNSRFEYSQHFSDERVKIFNFVK